MNCPVCNRNNAVSLSMCPSCGTMVNDSIRQKYNPTISSGPLKVKPEIKKNMSVPEKTNPQVKTVSEPKMPLKTATMEIAASPTSPTLVDFHNKNAALPDWRLQLKNAVRKRNLEGTEILAESHEFSSPRQAKLPTNGANALKVEIIEQPAPVRHKNPTLSSALERIEKSRRQFLEEETTPPAPVVSAPAAGKNYPFYIASKQNEATLKSNNINTSVNVPTKPKLAVPLPVDSEPLDTNKLPPLPQAIRESSFAKSLVNTFKFETKSKEKAETEKSAAVEDGVEEEFDDCASFAARFNAGLFDLIIGFCASLLLLTPFIMTGENWFSFTGFFGLLATCAVVMFIYLTTAIGMYGRTLGMQIFSLETVDVDGDEYPTLHQAAVSSAVYLLSLACGGIGFLTMLFNDEKRALHDIVSKTIIIREI